MNYHTTTKVIPFQALCRYVPSQLALEAIQTPVVAVEEWVCDRQKWNELVRHNLLQARNRMKQFVNRSTSETSFQVGDFVYLKLQPYR